MTDSRLTTGTDDKKTVVLIPASELRAGDQVLTDSGTFRLVERVWTSMIGRLFVGSRARVATVEARLEGMATPRGWALDEMLTVARPATHQAPATEPVPFIQADPEPQGYAIPSPEEPAAHEAAQADGSNPPVRVISQFGEIEVMRRSLFQEHYEGLGWRIAGDDEPITEHDRADDPAAAELPGDNREVPAEPEPTLAQQQAAGLRVLADMIEANPELAENFSYALGFSGIKLIGRSTDAAAEMAMVGRIARRYGATTTKNLSDKMFNLVMDFGAVKTEFLAYRDEVCERVVTGTREIVEEIPDPAALAKVPTTTVTRVVEDVEWVCRPLLAADTQNAPVTA